MARNKEGRPEWFKFWRRNREMIDVELLDMRSRGVVFTNMMRYFDGDQDNLESMTPVECMAFNFLKSSIDDSFEDFEKIADRNRENGRNGGRPKKNPENPVGFLETQKTQTNPENQKTEERRKKAEDRGQKTEKEERGQNTREREDVFSDYAEDDSELLEALQSFEEMRKKIKKPLTDRARQMTIDKLQTFPRDQWIPILNQSVFHSWQGLFPLKEEKPTYKEPDMSWRNDVYTGEEYGEEIYNPG